MPRSEVVILLVVLVLSSVWNLVAAVGIGLVIASLMFMKQIGDLMGKRSDVEPLLKEKAWPDEEDFRMNWKRNVLSNISKALCFWLYE